jgi:uncharacterized protein involved in outer membrane biogenesis
MKKFLFGLIGLVVIAVAALLVGPGLWDWNGYKPEILARIKAETGRQMMIDGDLSLAIVPSPRFAVDGVRIANIEGATAAEFARFKSLSVRVRLMPLLSGRIEVESVELIDPVIELERLADGRVNWEIKRPAETGGTEVSKDTAGRVTPTDAPSSGSQSFAIDRLIIRGGKLVYRDAAKGTVERLENLDVEGSAGSLAGPFGVNGTLTVRGLPLDVSASVGRLDDSGPAPLNLRLMHVGADAKVVLSGGIEPAKPEFRGKVDISGSDLRGLVHALSAGTAELPAWLGQTFALGLKIEASSTAVSIDGIGLRIGDTSASGGINAVLGDRIRVDAALKVNRIDLDKWHARATRPVAVAPSGNGGGATGRAAEPEPGATSASGEGFTLPAGIDAALDVSVEAIAFKGRQMREITLAMALHNGALKLSRFGARLPGGGKVSLTGALTAAGGKVGYRGETSVRADNLRAILDWLEVDVANVPADRLRSFQLKAKFDGDQKQVQIADLEMRLDASRIQGGITYALRARPAFGARITVDQVNLDAYLPRTRRAGTGTARTDQTAAAPSSGTTAPAPGAKPTSSASPLAALDAFDANVVLRVGTLNFRRTPIQGLFLDTGLVRGVLTIRRASVRNVSGTTGRITGTLRGFAGFPVFNGSFSASSKDVTGLFRIAGIDSPVAPRKLGWLKLDGKADAGADKIKLQTTLQLAGAKLELGGQITELAATPRLDLSLRVRHPDSAKLARLFGAEIGAPRRKLGGFDLGAKAKGPLDGIELAARLAAVDATVTFAGKVTQAVIQPGVIGTIEVRHPDFVRLVRTFDAGYRPAKPAAGPLRLSSRVSATETTARLDDLKGQIGATSFAGVADIALSGPKPTLTAKLTAGDIDLNTFLPAGTGDGKSAPASPAVVAAPAVPTGGKPGARRYSRDPIDLSALRAYDGDVELSAASVTWRTFRVDAPRLTAKLKDSVLTVSELAGKMFGGGFGLNGVLDAKRVPKLDGKVKIAGANVGKALFAGRQYDITNGVLDFDMKIAATGKSQHDMVSALDGQGRLAVRDGIITGFDLQAVNDRLKNLERSLDLLSLFAGAMQGGTTKFSSLDGTMRIEKGVVRTDDFRMISEAGRGEAKGFTDLPNWNMDMQAMFRLTGHSNSPPFRVQLTGPPDQPDQKIDYAALQKFLVGRLVESGVGSLLNKVLPGIVPQRQSKTQAPSQPAPSSEPEQPPPQQIKPKDFIRGLLKGLGR